MFKRLLSIVSKYCHFATSRVSQAGNRLMPFSQQHFFKLYEDEQNDADCEYLPPGIDADRRRSEKLLHRSPIGEKNLKWDEQSDCNGNVAVFGKALPIPRRTKN